MMEWIIVYVVSFLLVIAACKYDKDDSCVGVAFVPVVNTVMAIFAIIYVTGSELSKWIKK